MLTETVPNGGSLSAMKPLTNWQQPYVTLNAVAMSPATSFSRNPVEITFARTDA